MINLQNGVYFTLAGHLSSDKPRVKCPKATRVRGCCEQPSSSALKRADSVPCPRRVYTDLLS